MIHNLEISSDKTKLDLDTIHQFLTQSYWARGISRYKVADSLRNSFCVGAYSFGRQIGLVRVITDYTSFAYLCDVFVLPEFRGNGIAQSMLSTLLEHPDFQGLRRWVLVTRDAQDLYKKLGFTELEPGKSFMQIHKPDVYLRV